MNRDGSALRQLTNTPGEGAETPVWSPDSAFIAFAAYSAEGNNDVYIMRADGTDVRPLTNSPGYDDHPHWSADGERIIFNSDRDTPDPAAPWEKRWHDIWSIRPDGTGLVKLTDCRTACTFGSLSPNGEYLLYRRVDDTTGLNWLLEAGVRNSEIYIARQDGSEPRRLAGHPAFDGWPAWSPDGTWIAFASNRSGPAMTAQLWLVRPDGSDLHQITFGEWGHAQPAWTADSRMLTAYRFQENGQTEYGGIMLIELQPESE
jgi:TolB protein